MNTSVAQIYDTKIIFLLFTIMSKIIRCQYSMTSYMSFSKYDILKVMRIILNSDDITGLTLHKW